MVQSLWYTPIHVPFEDLPVRLVPPPLGDRDHTPHLLVECIVTPEFLVYGRLTESCSLRNVDP